MISRNNETNEEGYRSKTAKKRAGWRKSNLASSQGLHRRDKRVYDCWKVARSNYERENDEGIVNGADECPCKLGGYVLVWDSRGRA